MAVNLFCQREGAGPQRSPFSRKHTTELDKISEDAFSEVEKKIQNHQQHKGKA